MVTLNDLGPADDWMCTAPTPHHPGLACECWLDYRHDGPHECAHGWTVEQ